MDKNPNPNPKSEEITSTRSRDNRNNLSPSGRYLRDPYDRNSGVGIHSAAATAVTKFMNSSRDDGGEEYFPKADLQRQKQGAINRAGM